MHFKHRVFFLLIFTHSLLLSPRFSLFSSYSLVMGVWGVVIFRRQNETSNLHDLKWFNFTLVGLGSHLPSSFHTFERWIAHTWFLSHEELSFDVYYYSCISLSDQSPHSKFDLLHNWLTRSTCHKCSCERALTRRFGWACVWVNHNIAGAKQCNQSLFILSECTPCVCVCDFQLIDFFFYKFRSSKNYIALCTQTRKRTRKAKQKKYTLSFPLLCFLCVDSFWRANDCVRALMWVFRFNRISMWSLGMHFRAYTERFVYHVIWHLARHNTKWKRTEMGKTKEKSTNFQFFFPFFPLFSSGLWQ